ncbi:uncharacterized protein LOC115259808 [Aedes albopictus]|uniref:Translation elongation factor ef-1 alpha/tu n=1 Tax=Aedes albopictus TaxID=7160 RepID=A0ABM1XWG1_AEDAL
MSGFRKNTLIVDFSVVPGRPDVRKVEHFLESELQLNLSDVKSIQLHNTRNCVYIEMVNHDTALRYEKAHNIKRAFVWKDKPFKIPVYVDSEAVTVRVHDLPPSVPHTTVANFMKKYGDVFSIQTERWKNYFVGIPNGVRVLLMRIKHPIPSYLTIADEICYVEHMHQIRICRWCSRPVHPKQRCLEATAPQPETSTTAAAATAQSSEQIFSDADFPPMSSSQSTPSSPGVGETFIEIVARSKRALIEQEQKTIVPANQADQVDQQSTNGDNDDDEDDDGHDSSSLPYETNDGTNKRRLSTKRAKDKKKLCGTQELQSGCDSISLSFKN